MLYCDKVTIPGTRRGGDGEAAGFAGRGSSVMTDTAKAGTINTFHRCAPPHTLKMKDIGYDEFGQRAELEYGNGVQTEYTYNPERRWLERIVTTGGTGSVLQNISYDINPVGNVNGYENDADLYYTKQSYGYDSLYQLVTVNGESKNYQTSSKQLLTMSSEYSQRFAFDGAGNGKLESKHIFVGETRIATKRREERNDVNLGEESRQIYYYHGDHLGSAQLVTDSDGKTYEQLEYTPYGELWVEHEELPTGATPFRFTGKERDGETGLYYFGARYLNPQTSMWLSADPAMGEYVPQAPINDEAKKHNENLPGMGGVFNYVNLHAYHYAGNNPIKLVDPDGRDGVAATLLWQSFLGDGEDVDYSNNLDFLYTFTQSPTMNALINDTVAKFKVSGLNKNTYTGTVSFYNNASEIDLRLGVGLGNYSINISKETKTVGIFNKKQVTVYHVTVTISDYYNFDNIRTSGSVTDKLNNWGYDRQNEGDIKPFKWSFTYSFELE
jgi:RHS repeat-associated protein